MTAEEVVPVDGPRLRELRREREVPLREVARVGFMSHGHLSKVERGLPGRPVTDTIIDAYERALEIDLSGGFDLNAAGLGITSPRARRRRTIELAAVAHGRPIDRGFAATLSEYPPVTIGDVGPDLAPAVEVAALLAREPEATNGAIAETLLRWLADLLDRDEPDATAMRAAVSLAISGAKGADHRGRYSAAHSLRLVALRLAVMLDDPDLRATTLVRMAGQFADAGWHEAHDLVRLAAGDERLSDGVKAELEKVRDQINAPRG